METIQEVCSSWASTTAVQGHEEPLAIKLTGCGAAQRKVESSKH